MNRPLRVGDKVRVTQQTLDNYRLDDYRNITGTVIAVMADLIKVNFPCSKYSLWNRLGNHLELIQATDPTPIREHCV